MSPRWFHRGTARRSFFLHDCSYGYVTRRQPCSDHLSVSCLATSRNSRIPVDSSSDEHEYSKTYDRLRRRTPWTATGARPTGHAGDAGHARLHGRRCRLSQGFLGASARSRMRARRGTTAAPRWGWQSHRLQSGARVADLSKPRQSKRYDDFLLSFDARPQQLALGPAGLSPMPGPGPRLIACDLVPCRRCLPGDRRPGAPRPGGNHRQPSRPTVICKPVIWFTHIRVSARRRCLKPRSHGGV